RSAGTALHQGALVNPDGLPPGFGGAPGVTAMLEWLQSRQFVAWERTGGGLRPTQPTSPLSAFPIDWDALRRRRQADLSKLDAVQHYAYAKGCRRGFVLRYFGDPAARQSCDGCDNCLGTHRESATPARKPARAKRGAPSTAGAAPVSGAELSPADATLVASLRSLRGTIARTEQLPAYCVFKDRTLTEMAVRRPRSLDALAALNGVGPAKLEKYGERFLALISGTTDIEAA
ncbi:MAG: HRDC domain-containing protein, partial [Gemmatimonadaceae bacterium]